MPSNGMKRKAKLELHENAEQVEAHLESFRRWIRSLPHITFPNDRSLLLAFLRHAKYIHSKAQTRFDNFCTVRASPTFGCSDWFDYPPLNDPDLKEYLDNCPIVDLGRTEEGVSMVLFRKTPWSMDSNNRSKIRRFGFMDFDRYLLDETTQIAGYGMFMDMTGMEWSEMLPRQSMRESKLETWVWQDCMPIRTKHLIYYNEPAFADMLFKLFEPWLNEKIKQRMLRIKTNLKLAYEKVPGLQKIMPEEYGGENGPLAQLVERHKRDFLSFYAKTSPMRVIRVNESKRPSSTCNLIPHYPDLNFTGLGTEGTYIEIRQDS